MNLFSLLKPKPAPQPVRYVVATKADNRKVAERRAKVKAELEAFVQGRGQRG